MCKEGCCVRLGQEGVVGGLGEVFKKPKKRVKKKKKRLGERKILEREVKLGEGVGALKREGGWNPLTNWGYFGDR